jgi:uncharacterized repeat protein (TIGR01451 family)
MKGTRLIGSVAMAMALVLAPAAVPAQQKSAIQLTSIAEVEITEKNASGATEVKRREAALAKVVPGNIVIFTTRYVNTGKEPASNVTIMNPVPEHMSYIDKSVEGKGARIDFSVDGGKTYGQPDKLTVKDGQGKVRPALPKDYTHIRWVLSTPLAPGGTGSVSFRAQLK